MVKIGVINVSDRASQGVYEDIPGKEAVRLLRKYLVTEFEPVYRVIPDERDQLEEAMKFLADEAGCCLVVTVTHCVIPFCQAKVHHYTRRSLHSYQSLVQQPQRETGVEALVQQ